MDLKKSDKANLENKRFLFREIGFIIVLLLLYAVFEYSASPADVTDIAQRNVENIEFEMAEVTREPEMPKPLVERVQPAKVPENPKIIETTNAAEDESNKLKGSSSDQHEEIKFDFESASDVEENIFVRVEKMPTFPGGDNALMLFISQNLIYPQEAINLRLEGTVVIRFVVDKNGKASKAEVYKSLAPLLDKAALDVINKLPRFTPGEQGGNKVPVYFNLPIQFGLGR